MLCTMRQAQTLRERYCDRMTAEQLAMVGAYARLPFMSKTERAWSMFKFQFFKHGVTRTIGFLVNLLMLERSA